MTDETRHRRNSKWLGPKTRERLYGRADAGVPRPTKGPAAEPAGFHRGAKVR